MAKRNQNHGGKKKITCKSIVMAYLYHPTLTELKGYLNIE